MTRTRPSGKRVHPSQRQQIDICRLTRHNVGFLKQRHKTDTHKTKQQEGLDDELMHIMLLYTQAASAYEHDHAQGFTATSNMPR